MQVFYITVGIIGIIYGIWLTLHKPNKGRHARKPNWEIFSGIAIVLMGLTSALGVLL